MKVIHMIYHIARADLLERIRQYAFLIILGITMLAAYFFVPPVEARYVTLYLDEYRGVYNSAWIGSSVAISTTLFLALFGFYLVKNSIQRDEVTRVGQIIATTSVKKLYYLIGKWISNFAALSIIVFVVIVIALIMQWVRGEEMVVELWPLVSPFLFLTLPTMSIVAAMAVLFETRQALKGGLGNVIYFVLYLIFIASSRFMVFGPNVIISDMLKELTTIRPDFSGTYGLGIVFQETPLQLFEWHGVKWTGGLLQQQLSLFLFAFLLILVAVLLFHGFRDQAAKGRGKRKPFAEVTIDAKTHIDLDNAGVDLKGNYVRSDARVRMSALTSATVRDSFLSLVYAEWRLMMKSASLAWYVVAGILFVLCLVFPVTTSAQWMIWPITWIWPLVFWSGMGSRETRYQTQYLVASSPRFATRQLSAMWISGVMLTCITGGGVIIRMIMEGDPEYLMAFISAVILIPSLALASGVLTKTNRTFEVIYMIVWYLGPFNKIPYLDFLGTRLSEGGSLIPSLSYMLISSGLLMAAYVSRRRLAQTF
ncbi:hypothetical protein [Paenibacillus monticola]|uniref:Uncharacterized protein n=1 Tax=Paenibacillus monticola TaxID=2666075 RepID=A0A7X2H5T0_9BACL|nr:hypothetical protein [Paenibacillus monticola]MRN53955.1 hypothetical protein [Paenibacillus monticola]